MRHIKQIFSCIRSWRQRFLPYFKVSFRLSRKGKMQCSLEFETWRGLWNERDISIHINLIQSICCNNDYSTPLHPSLFSSLNLPGLTLFPCYFYPVWQHDLLLQVGSNLHDLEESRIKKKLKSFGEVRAALMSAQIQKQDNAIFNYLPFNHCSSLQIIIFAFINFHNNFISAYFTALCWCITIGLQT